MDIMHHNRVNYPFYPPQGGQFITPGAKKQNLSTYHTDKPPENDTKQYSCNNDPRHWKIITQYGLFEVIINQSRVVLNSLY